MHHRLDDSMTRPQNHEVFRRDYDLAREGTSSSTNGDDDDVIYVLCTRIRVPAFTSFLLGQRAARAPRPLRAIDISTVARDTRAPVHRRSDLLAHKRVAGHRERGYGRLCRSAAPGNRTRARARDDVSRVLPATHSRDHRGVCVCVCAARDCCPPHALEPALPAERQRKRERRDAFL